MLAEGYITVAQRDAIYHEELPFNRGFFRYDHSIIYDLLQEEFESSAIQAALEAANITNISTEGLHIVTTIDKTLQERSEYALRQHLTSLSGRLGDTTSAAPLRRPSGLLPQLNTALEPFHFMEGVIAKKQPKQITVNIGGQSCVVDASGLDRSARNLKTSRAKLLKRLPVHGRLLVSMRDSKNCDIELDGMLQGGLLATHKGEIVAIVGGRKNKYFNRATQAKLQLGSVWKTVIYAAAIQLGWSATDHLDNHHSAFVYSGVGTFPKDMERTHPNRCRCCGPEPTRRTAPVCGCSII